MNTRQFVRQLTAAPAPTELTGDMKSIWDIYEESKMVALKKNSDYGSSFNEPPVLAPALPTTSAILVRMSDKVKRINSLMQKDAGDPAVAESIRDTINDLGCYCFLWQIAESTAVNKSRSLVDILNDLGKEEKAATTGLVVAEFPPIIVNGLLEGKK